VSNAHNTVFGWKGLAICAQAVYFMHSTRPSVTWLTSRWWLAVGDWSNDSNHVSAIYRIVNPTFLEKIKSTVINPQKITRRLKIRREFQLPYTLSDSSKQQAALVQ